MPTIVNVAIELEKVMEFLVQAWLTPDSIANFKPTKEHQEQQPRRERMWGVIQNFLRRAMKGAYPDKETLILPRGELRHDLVGPACNFQHWASYWSTGIDSTKYRQVFARVNVALSYQKDFGYEWIAPGPLQKREPNKEIHRELPEGCPV